MIFVPDIEHSKWSLFSISNIWIHCDITTHTTYSYWYAVSRAGVGNLLHLKSQISPFVAMRNLARAAKLPSGPKTSVIPKMIPKKGLCLPPKRATTGGSKSRMWLWSRKLPTPDPGHYLIICCKF